MPNLDFNDIDGVDVLWQHFTRWHTKVNIIANGYSLPFQLYISYHDYISKCVGNFFIKVISFELFNNIDGVDVLWQHFMRWYTKVSIIANRYYSLPFQLYISYHDYISKCVGNFFSQSHLIWPFYKYSYIAVQCRSGPCRRSCRSIFIFQVFFTSYMHMHIILNYDIFLDNN